MAHLDQDALWKNLIEQFFPDCIGFFFPEFAALVDWEKGIRFLDKEFQSIEPGNEHGRKYADSLVKVYFYDQSEQWLLIHLEVQNQATTDFAERVFVYNYRIYDKYRKPVFSLAILGDENSQWRPHTFGYNILEYGTNIRFGNVKLLDYKEQREYLAAHPNPFALAVLAHLIALEFKNDPERRLVEKLWLVRQLKLKGWDKETIRGFFIFLDIRVELPAALEQNFIDEIKKNAGESLMQIISPFEALCIEKGMKEGIQEGKKVGIQEGKKEGMKEGIQIGLQKAEKQSKLETLSSLLLYRFGTLEEPYLTYLQDADLEKLKRWIGRCFQNESLEVIFRDA